MIRPVTPEDAAAIAQIYNHYVENTTVSFETDPVSVDEMRWRIVDLSAGYPYYVWEENGTVVGYCYVHGWKTKAAYNATVETTIYLSPDAFGRGIGRALMDVLVVECRRRGLRVLIACITADNAGSIVFHERLGFKKVSHFEGVGMKFDRLLDVVDYQLTL